MSAQDALLIVWGLALGMAVFIASPWRRYHAQVATHRLGVARTARPTVTMAGRRPVEAPRRGMAARGECQRASNFCSRKSRGHYSACERRLRETRRANVSRAALLYSIAAIVSRAIRARA
jgi:hypothetical protein